MKKKNLQEQLNHFLEMPSVLSRFTKELYETIHIRSGFIAHFNREGFHKARFWTLRDFDLTIELMTLDNELKVLLDNCPADLIPQARFKVAQLEYAYMNAQIKVMESHCQDLQSNFIKKF